MVCVSIFTADFEGGYGVTLLMVVRELLELTFRIWPWTPSSTMVRATAWAT